MQILARNAVRVKTSTVLLTGQAGALRVHTYTHILACHMERADADI